MKKLDWKFKYLSWQFHNKIEFLAKIAKVGQGAHYNNKLGGPLLWVYS